MCNLHGALLCRGRVGWWNPDWSLQAHMVAAIEEFAKLPDDLLQWSLGYDSAIINIQVGAVAAVACGEVW